MIKITCHQRQFPRFLLLLFSFLLIGCLLNGCASGRPSKEPSKPIELGEVLVMPFDDMQQMCGIDSSFKCPFLGSMHEVGKVREGAGEFLTEHLMSRLRDEKKMRLIDPGQAVGVRSKILSKNDGELSQKELILEMARSVGAQSVILGRVFQYRERIGTSYSVEVPASVAFDLILLRVSDGQVLWADHFAETQKSLSENLFLLGTFIKRGGRWLTADELAESGLRQLLNRFPDTVS